MSASLKYDRGAIEDLHSAIKGGHGELTDLLAKLATTARNGADTGLTGTKAGVAFTAAMEQSTKKIGEVSEILESLSNQCRDILEHIERQDETMAGGFNGLT